MSADHLPDVKEKVADQMRVDFERRASGLGYSIDPDTRPGREGGYWSSHTNLMWEAWLAAHLRCAALCEQEHHESGEHPEMALHCRDRVLGVRPERSPQPVKEQNTSEARHQFHDREDCLHHCKVCNGAEASLPINCPGRRMTEEEERAVLGGTADFVHGLLTRAEAYNPAPGVWRVVVGERVLDGEHPRRWKAEAQRADELRRLQARPRVMCDGDHGGPPCDDPECWNDTPAPQALPRSAASPELNSGDLMAAMLRDRAGS